MFTRDLAFRATLLAVVASLTPFSVAVTWQVAPTGSDSANGTTAPFASLTKAIASAAAGDTILMHGGTYNVTSTVSISSTKNGTAAKPFTIAPFGNGTPVLDFTNQAFSSSARGIALNGDYWNIRGLTIANAKDSGINISGSNNVIDRLVVRNCQDSGVQISAGSGRVPSNNLVVNTDSYNNYDAVNHGENADGFAIKFRDVGPGNVLRGVRAWGNSDDGFDFWGSSGGVTVENSLAFKNGFNTFGDTAWAGDGNGLKLGHDSSQHVLRNNLIWGNRLNGIDVNGNAEDDVGPGIVAHGVTIYNNTAYNNGAGGQGFNYNFDESFAHVLKNNIAVAGGSGNANMFSGVVHTNNSWNAGLGVTTNDFLSLSDTILTGPRLPDGSLPYSDFLRLKPTSAAIDKGVNVGLAYNGTAPDLGAYEVPEPSCMMLLGTFAMLSCYRRRG